jgi:LAS superfamily LD-carboxypeptidase LdcB
MDSDKTIDVRCKLYDVTVLVQEGVQNAYLAGANVTVYNSTSVQGNKITSGVTGNNGQVQLLNLPNNTLTFTQYGGASYSLVIGNTTRLVSSENQAITLTADQNNINTNNNYSIIAFAGMTIPFKSSFITKRLKKKMRKRKMEEWHRLLNRRFIF